MRCFREKPWDPALRIRGGKTPLGSELWHVELHLDINPFQKTVDVLSRHTSRFRAMLWAAKETRRRWREAIQEANQ